MGASGIRINRFIEMPVIDNGQRHRWNTTNGSEWKQQYIEFAAENNNNMSEAGSREWEWVGKILSIGFRPLTRSKDRLKNAAIVSRRIDTTYYCLSR